MKSKGRLQETIIRISFSKTFAILVKKLMNSLLWKTPRVISIYLLTQTKKLFRKMVEL